MQGRAARPLNGQGTPEVERAIDPIRFYNDLVAEVIVARRKIEGMKGDARRILNLMETTPQYFRFAQLDESGLPPLGHCSIVYPTGEEWPTAAAFQQAFVEWHAAGSRLESAWQLLSPEDQQVLWGANPANAGAPILR
jgi:hypothetical protein